MAPDGQLPGRTWAGCWRMLRNVPERVDRPDIERFAFLVNPNEDVTGMDAQTRLPDRAGSPVPLVVCVSADPAVRQRVVRQLDGDGVVLMCPDLDALRPVLGPAPPCTLSYDTPVPTAGVVPICRLDV